MVGIHFLLPKKMVLRKLEWERGTEKAKVVLGVPVCSQQGSCRIGRQYATVRAARDFGKSAAESSD